MIIAECILKEIWTKYGKREKSIEEFLKLRKQVKEKSAKVLAYMYKRSLADIAPTLREIEKIISDKLMKLEREYYRKHKTLSSYILDEQLELQRQIVAHYQRNILDLKK